MIDGNCCVCFVETTAAFSVSLVVQLHTVASHCVYVIAKRFTNDVLETKVQLHC